MQNKKLLSVLLSLVLVCTCAIGMLILNVSGEDGERTAVEFTVDAENSLNDVLAAIADAEFAPTEKAVIYLTEDVEAWVENSIIFGFQTKFDTEGKRLPIEFLPAAGLEAKSVAITFNTVSGSVVCANSYTFRDIGFHAADAAKKLYFFAGSGEVVLKNVDLSATGTGKNAYLYADNAVANAFVGWGEPEGLIPVSLTLDTVDYSWSDSCISTTGVKGSTAAQVSGVSWTRAEFVNLREDVSITAEDLAVTLKIVDSKITGVHGRPMNAVSPIASLDLIIEDTSDDNSKTVIPQLTGIGNSGENSGGLLSNKPNFGKFDFTANIEGGSFGGAGGQYSAADGTKTAAAKSRTQFFRNVSYDGDLIVNISGGTFAGTVFGGWRDESCEVTGTAQLNISGGTFATVYGPASHGDNENETPETIQNLTTVTGGSFTTLASCQGAQVSTKVTIGGTAKIGTYYGSWNSTGGGSDAYIPWVINTVEGSAEVGIFYGSGNPKSEASKYNIVNLQNNMLGGKILKSFYGTGNHGSIGTVENNFFGTAWAATYKGSDNKNKDVVLSATYTAVKNITGSVTTNFMQAKQTAAAYFYAVGGGTFNCDVTVNTNVVLGADGSHGVSTSNDSGKHPRLYGAAAAAQINGDVHWNLNKIQGTIGQSFFGTSMSVDGNYSLNLIGRSNYFTMSSNMDMGPASCTGDVNVHLANSKIDYASGKTYNARVLRSDIGGKLTFVAENCELTSEGAKTTMDAANRVRLSTVKQVGDVSVTLIDTKVTGYDLMDFDVDGRLELAVKGNCVFTYADSGTANYPWPSGNVKTLVNRFIDGAVVSADFYGTGGKVPVENVVNEFYAGSTVNGKFYGTGAATIDEANGTFTGSPVGKWVTTGEGEEAVTVWQPGNVENYIYGGTFNSVFFGTGDQTVNKVTTTMTGGTITGFGDLAVGEYPSIATPKVSSEVVTSLGCYYGNYGPVVESVTNNIYSGVINNNFYGSNNELTCPVINNIGNNLYNELHPEAPLTQKANLERTVFAGGEWVGTSATGKSTEVNPCSGYVVIHVDGADFGRTTFLAGHVNSTNPETGNAVDINIQNAKFYSHTYLVESGDVPIAVKTGEEDGEAVYDVIDTVATPVIRGAAYVVVGDRNDTSGTKTVTLAGSTHDFEGFGRSLKGDFTFIVSNTQFGYKTNLLYDTHADGSVLVMDVTADFYNCDFRRQISDFTKVGSGKTINGTYISKFSHCVFNSSGVAGNSGVTQIANRPFKNHIFEMDSCTVNSTNMKTAMQASTTSKVYIYGDNVIGSPSFQLTRQTATVAYIGVKPGENGELIPVETSFEIKEGAAVYGVADDKATTASKVNIYDVTVTGEGFFAPFKDADTATAAYDYTGTVKSTFKLIGNVMIPNGENPTVFVNAAEAGASVSPAPGEPWADPSVSDKVYLVAKDASVLANVVGRSFSGSAGYAKKVGNTIVGAVFTPSNECMVNVDVQERLYINLWIPKENLVTYLESGMLNLAGENAFDVKAVLGGDVPSGRDRILGCVSIDMDYVEANTRVHEGVEYVVAKIGAVAANDFATTITFEGSEMTVLLGSNDMDLSETNMLILAENGIAKYAADQKLCDLFTSLYNYGASACGLELKAMEGLEIADNGADPAASVVATDKVKFTGMALLMGDAIGIRFKGNLVDAEKEDITLSVSVNGGVEHNVANFNVFDGATAGSIVMDTYLNLGNVSDVLTFNVKVKGETALTVTTCVKGYSEKIAGSGDPKAEALAQFAQAIYNWNSAEQN